MVQRTNFPQSTNLGGVATPVNNDDAVNKAYSDQNSGSGLFLDGAGTNTNATVASGTITLTNAVAAGSVSSVLVQSTGAAGTEISIQQFIGGRGLSQVWVFAGFPNTTFTIASTVGNTGQVTLNFGSAVNFAGTLAAGTILQYQTVAPTYTPFRDLVLGTNLSGSIANNAVGRATLTLNAASGGGSSSQIINTGAAYTADNTGVLVKVLSTVSNLSGITGSIANTVDFGGINITSTPWPPVIPAGFNTNFVAITSGDGTTWGGVGNIQASPPAVNQIAWVVKPTSTLSFTDARIWFVVNSVGANYVGTSNMDAQSRNPNTTLLYPELQLTQSSDSLGGNSATITTQPFIDSRIATKIGSVGTITQWPSTVSPAIAAVTTTTIVVDDEILGPQLIGQYLWVNAQANQPNTVLVASGMQTGVQYTLTVTGNPITAGFTTSTQNIFFSSSATPNAFTFVQPPRDEVIRLAQTNCVPSLNGLQGNPVSITAGSGIAVATTAPGTIQITNTGSGSGVSSSNFTTFINDLGSSLGAAGYVAFVSSIDNTGWVGLGMDSDVASNDGGFIGSQKVLGTTQGTAVSTYGYAAQFPFATTYTDLEIQIYVPTMQVIFFSTATSGWDIELYFSRADSTPANDPGRSANLFPAFRSGPSDLVSLNVLRSSQFSNIGGGQANQIIATISSGLYSAIANNYTHTDITNGYLPWIRIDGPAITSIGSVTINQPSSNAGNSGGYRALAAIPGVGGATPTLDQVLTVGNTSTRNLTLTGTAVLAAPNLALNNAGANTITLRTPASVASSYALTLPSATPTYGQSLVTTDATGNTNWFLAGLEMIRLASTVNVSPSGAQTVDGVAVVTNDRVLLTNQTATAEQGLYIANTTAAWTRVTTYPSQSLFVTAGTANNNRTYTRNEVASPEQWILTSGGGSGSAGTLQQVLTAGNTANTNLVLTGNATLQATGGLQLNGTGTGFANIRAASSTTPSGYVMTLPAAQGAANTILTNDGNGDLTWSVNNATLTRVLTNNNTANNLNLILTGSGLLQTTAGLQLNGSTSGAVTLRAAATTGYPLTFPALQASVANQTLVNDTNGILSWGAPTLQLVLGSNNTANATNIVLTGSGRFVTTAGLQLNGLTSGNVSFAAPSTVTTSYTLTMPPAQGLVNQTLLNDGSGNLSWGSSAGNLTQVLTAGNTANNLNLVLTGTGLLQSTAGLQLNGSTSGNTTIRAAATIATNYSLVLPAAQGLVNQTLVNDGSGNLSWGSSAGNLTAVLTAGNTANNLNLVLTGTGLLQSTAGLQLNGSTSGNVTLRSGATPTSYTLYLPAVQATAANQALVNDGTGILSWGSPNLQQVLASGNSANAANILLSGGRFITNIALQLNGSTTGNIMVQAPSIVTTNHTLTLPPAQGAANTVLQNDGTGTLSWAPNASTLTQVLTAGNTANNLNLVLTGTGLLVSTAGLRLAGSTSGNITIQAAATTTSYGLVLPGAQGALNTTLLNDGLGNLSWGTSAGGATRQIAAISTANVTPLSGATVVDGYTPVNGDLVLLTNQTTASEQGLYSVNTAGSWTKQTTAVLDSFFALNGTFNVGTTYSRTAVVPNENFIRTAVNAATGAVETLQQTCNAGNITNTGILLGTVADNLQLAQTQIARNAAGNLTIRAGTTITNAVIIGNSAATAVNSLAITGAATGNAPTLAATGDTNLSLNIAGAGTGNINLGTNQASYLQVVPSATSPVVVRPFSSVSTNVILGLQGQGASGVDLSSNFNNFVRVLGAVSGAVPTISAIGDVNASLNIAGNGTGVVQLGTNQTNFLRITPTGSGTAPTLRALGDTNVSLNIAASGTGNINLGTHQANFVQVLPTASGAPALAAAGGGNLNLNIQGSGNGAVAIGTNQTNSVVISGSAGSPTISASGAGVISLQLSGASTGAVVLNSNQVNSLSVTGGAAGAPVVLATRGDANGIMALRPLGAGTLTLGQDGTSVTLGPPNSTLYSTPLLACNAATPTGNLVAGTAGQVLTSRGANLTPAWTAAGGANAVAYGLLNDQSVGNSAFAFNTTALFSGGTSFGSFTSSSTFTFTRTGFYQASFAYNNTTGGVDLSIVIATNRVGGATTGGKQAIIGGGNVTAANQTLQVVNFATGAFSASQCVLIITRLG